MVDTERQEKVIELCNLINSIEQMGYDNTFYETSNELKYEIITNLLKYAVSNKYTFITHMSNTGESGYCGYFRYDPEINENIEFVELYEDVVPHCFRTSNPEEIIFRYNSLSNKTKNSKNLKSK